MLFYNVFHASILERKMVQTAMYTMVLAIFRFPKRWPSGTKNQAFFFRFGFDRKSLRPYVYKHFCDFELSKNAFLFVFARRPFWSFVRIRLGKCASNSHTYAKWDPPFKMELPKEGRELRSQSCQKRHFGGTFRT